MIYNSPDDVHYLPEEAIEWSAQMAEELEQHVKGLTLRSDYLKNEWLEKIENFKVRDLPPTLIAVCGTTGAGKSSLINAILEDSIVPTSAMRACTSVATQVSYHEESTIKAEIEFISREEWLRDLETSIHDLKDEKGKLISRHQRSDVKYPAGRAWQKIHTVYPQLKAEDAIAKSPDDIIETYSSAELVKLFGNEKPIESANSTDFASKIAQYVDSADRRSSTARSTLSKDQSSMVLWPLIRVVRIAVKADALKSGAVLVDLPGFGDSNLARSDVAHEFIQKCDYIWIVSKVQRAVDDQDAQKLQGNYFRTQIMNGNYNAKKISFIMTQTDQLDSAEIAQALNLSGSGEFRDTVTKLCAARTEIAEWDAAAEEADDEVQITTTQIHQLESDITRCKARLTTSGVKKEEPQELHFVPSEDPADTDTRKRRYTADFRVVKKARLSEGTEVDRLGNVQDLESLMELDRPSMRERVDVGARSGWEETVDDKESMLEILNKQLQRWQKASSDARFKSSELQRTVKELERIQDEFCSKKRNEYVKDAARDQFQEGISHFFDHPDEPESEALEANEGPRGEHCRKCRELT